MSAQRPRPVSLPKPAPRPSAEPLTLPADGKIDLDGGDWVRISTKPTVEQVFALLDGFEALQQARYDEALKLAERQANARKFHVDESLADFVAPGARAMFKFSLDALVSLTTEASMKGADGHETTAHDAEALRLWPLEKLLVGGRYAIALKDRLSSSGT